MNNWPSKPRLLLMGGIVVLMCGLFWYWSSEYLASLAPIPWNKYDASFLDREVKDGKTVVVYLTANSERTTSIQPMLMDEQRAMRRAFYRNRVVPFRVNLKTNPNDFDAIAELLNVQTVPAVVVFRNKSKPVVITDSKVWDVDFVVGVIEGRLSKKPIAGNSAGAVKSAEEQNAAPATPPR